MRSTAARVGSIFAFLSLAALWGSIVIAVQEYSPAWAGILFGAVLPLMIAVVLLGTWAYFHASGYRGTKLLIFCMLACLVAIVAAYLAIGRPIPFHGYALKAPKSLHGVAIVANVLFWSLMIAFAREIQLFGATAGRAWSVTAVFYYIAAACLLLGWLLYFMGLGGPSAPKDCGEPGEQACPVGSESTGYYLIVIGWLLGMSASLICHAIALVIASQAAPKPTASAK